jgi:xylose isomerase
VQKDELWVLLCFHMIFGEKITLVHVECIQKIYRSLRATYNLIQNKEVEEEVRKRYPVPDAQEILDAMQQNQDMMFNIVQQFLRFKKDTI